jgi:Fic family protein
MADFQRSYWEPRLGQGLVRRDSAGCYYDAYIPDRLAGRTFHLEGETAADLADAEAAIIRLNGDTTALTNSEALARMLLRAEAVASSRIEGLNIGSRRLLRVEAAIAAGASSVDITAEEILGNIRAMDHAVDVVARSPSITPELICDVHRELTRGTPIAQIGGTLRSQQNWIGGSILNPCRAAYVPPPPELVVPLVDDLAEFCNGEQLSPLAQAAVAHAQFEIIHPFADGNGRTGRALIHSVLRRRGVAPRFVPPISLVLAARSEEYIAGLRAMQYLGDPREPSAIASLNEWLSLFAGATLQATNQAAAFEQDIREIVALWRLRLGSVRRGSSLDLLIAALPAAPVFTVQTASALIGRSFQAVNPAIERLQEAGIARSINVARRNRAFEATELVDAFVRMEDRITSALA